MKEPFLSWPSGPGPRFGGQLYLDVHGAKPQTGSDSVDGEGCDAVSHSGSAVDEQEQIDVEVGFPAAPKPATWRAMSFEEREDLIVRARVWVQVKLDMLQDSRLLHEVHPAA